jgi:hypothetical protein
MQNRRDSWQCLALPSPTHFTSNSEIVSILINYNATCQSRIAAFGMRQLNVTQLAREGFYSEEVPDVMDLLSTTGSSPLERSALIY